ncbi:hypothetical protein HG535_0D04990 [Zygotorulaspora mrakii]|uniref:PX domain-containing protein n=1 Tax=Zygotorulaspora mrakii TaxID=42260 RepID=A0A7H9B2F3_ZYGMR|nr:uncharacterized protein HG535_0D04990 [Zygotorulaspora mrakii]QLG72790.1 hypothetical protein HG535_0D04990 [Zygotorulaspora mrakii]
MNIFGESEEEDNNPFAGTNHLYASGIAAVADGEDDFIPKGATIYDEINKDNDEGEDIETGSPVDSPINSFTQNTMKHDLKEQEKGMNSFENAAPTTSTKFEPYVSLTMSMAIGSNGQNSAETPDINITEAGDYKDPWGKHAIGYVIQFQGKEVVRRYSEFDTLRQALIRLLPTVIIPPIPSKHPLIKYFLNPLAAENDSKIIDKRKRMLTSFLNNCYAVEEIRNQVVFTKFLNPEYSWPNVLKSPPIAILPVNNLLAPPLNPTKPSPLHLLLPVTKSLSRLDPLAHNGSTLELEKQFAHLEARLKKFRLHLDPSHKIIKQHRLHFHNLGSLFAELGAYYNAFSLQANVISNEDTVKAIKMLSNAIEKIGHGFDVNYVCSEILIENLLNSLEEPIGEILHFLEDAQRVITFRKLKRLQFQIIEQTIQKRELRIKNLKEAQFQMKRLQEALQRNAQESPTIAEAIKHIEKKMSLSPTDDVPKQLQESELRPQEEQPRIEEISGEAPPDRDQISISNRRTTTRKKNRRSGELEPHLLTEHERQQEIQKLFKEIEKLNECFKLINKDMEDVNKSTLQTLRMLEDYINRKMGIMIKSFTKFVINWLTECLKAWKNARLIVNNIET